jgi:hypothetical protein
MKQEYSVLVDNKIINVNKKTYDFIKTLDNKITDIIKKGNIKKD